MKKPTIVCMDKAMPFSPPGLEQTFASRMLIDRDHSGSDRLQINHCVLKAGCRLPGAVHRPPYDEICDVLSGEAVLRMEGTDYELHPDTVVFIPGGTSHALTNKSKTEDFVLLTIWPGQPEPGANEVYDMRKSTWGRSYREIEDDVEWAAGTCLPAGSLFLEFHPLLHDKEIRESKAAYALERK